MDPSTVLRGELKRCVILDKDEIRELSVRWRKHGDQNAREQMVQSVLPWAMKLVDYYHAVSESYISRDDILSEAMWGLLAGVDHFDPDRGALTTCVAVWIRQKVVRYMATCSTSIQIPDYLASRLRRAVVLEEEVLENNDDKVVHAAAAKWGVRSIEVYKNGEEGLDAISLGEHEREQAAKENTELLQLAIESLPSRLKELISMRLGGMTLQQVGDVLGVSRQRTLQLEVEAKKLLRKNIDPALV